MKKTVYSLWFIVYSLTFLLAFTNISCAQNEGVGIGNKAPDFTLPDISGKQVSLKDTIAANKATLLVFGATWCPYCRNEIPELKQLNSSHAKKGLKILSVDIGESPKKVESFAKQQGIDYTVLVDEDNRVASQYGVMGIPANILVDQSGEIKYRGTAPPSEDQLP
ncbi:MAG: TlpA disulfide reductase family protein [Candidatus Omnitrophica bacterium]|nr:TlpA disulfide reductase family protein [Candidatus Omnitrophota bacterium]